MDAVNEFIEIWLFFIFCGLVGGPYGALMWGYRQYLDLTWILWPGLPFILLGTFLLALLCHYQTREWR